MDWISIKVRKPTEEDARPYQVETLTGFRTLDVVLWLDKKYGPRVGAYNQPEMYSYWTVLPDSPYENR
jgi:hypothetical protein